MLSNTYCQCLKPRSPTRIQKTNKLQQQDYLIGQPGQPGRSPQDKNKQDMHAIFKEGSDLHLRNEKEGFKDVESTAEDNFQRLVLPPQSQYKSSEKNVEDLELRLTNPFRLSAPWQTREKYPGEKAKWGDQYTESSSSKPKVSPHYDIKYHGKNDKRRIKYDQAVAILKDKEMRKMADNKDDSQKFGNAVKHDQELFSKQRSFKKLKPSSPETKKKDRSIADTWMSSPLKKSFKNVAKSAAKTLKDIESLHESLPRHSPKHHMRKSDNRLKILKYKINDENIATKGNF